MSDKRIAFIDPSRDPARTRFSAPGLLLVVIVLMSSASGVKYSDWVYCGCAVIALLTLPQLISNDWLERKHHARFEEMCAQMWRDHERWTRERMEYLNDLRAKERSRERRGFE